MFTRKIDKDLSLAIIDPNFSKDYVEIMKTDKEYIGRWIDFANQKGIDDEKFYLPFIKECLQQFADGSGFPCVMIYKGQVAGNVMFNSINKDTKSADLGYWIRQDLQGKGIVTKAVKKMIDIGFNEFDITRIQIRCATENTASKAIPKKFGFTLEGTIKQSAKVNGKVLDYDIYGLLKEVSLN